MQFDRTKSNIYNLKQQALLRTNVFYNHYFNSTDPCTQSAIMTNIQTEPCCHNLTPVGGCLVGTLCEGTGAMIDCSLTCCSCGFCNAQLLSDDGDDIEEEGSGCFQGSLGSIGNSLGNCLGSIFACVPYTISYAICLPKNCCIHYCCPPTHEEKEYLKQNIQQRNERIFKQQLERNIEQDLGPGALNVWRQIQSSSALQHNP